jgi:polyisoprenoid-binding protein YceI
VQVHTLTVGPQQGQLLLRTGVEGRAARLGHRLTLLVGSWQCTTEFEGGTPVSVALELQLPSLEVVRGEGGLKPLGAADRRRVLAGAAETLGRVYPVARWTSTVVGDAPGGYALDGVLDLHGHQYPCPVAVQVSPNGSGQRILATTSVRQTTWGIRPYSQMLGAMQVSDIVQVLVEVGVPRVDG